MEATSSIVVLLEYYMSAFAKSVLDVRKKIKRF